MKIACYIYLIGLFCCLVIYYQPCLGQHAVPPNKKWLDFIGGSSTYLFSYQSAIDTPYVDRDVLQNNISGILDVTVANKVPLRITYWGRYSNSNIFRNITDVQVSLNQYFFVNSLQQAIKQKLLNAAKEAQDSVLENIYQLKKQRLKADLDWLKNPFTLQRLIQANEIIQVPHITYNLSLPDSINEKRADTLRKAAVGFIEFYNKMKNRNGPMSKEVDSLEILYKQNIDKVVKLKELLETDQNSLASLNQLQIKAQKLGIAMPDMPARYKWMTGIRNLSVGRVPVNQSNLTAKNISIKGLNFEYNSWYYFAVTAGAIDYQFRDFAFPRNTPARQYMYLMRAGVGRLEHNYFILSAYKGKKQLFSGGNGPNAVNSIDIMGYSAEAKFQLTKYAYFVGEVATSISPDYHTFPLRKTTSFNFSDRTNKGFSLQAYGLLPRTNTRIEGMYKYTGINFQSFTSFQTSTALQSWSIKAEQYFIKRKIKVAASLKNNEFTNPFFVQDYSSNTVFKTVSATFRFRKLPILSVGYLPMSQLTILDKQTVETRFQMLNINVYHSYKLANVPLASTVTYNRFYNKGTDTTFAYYNAINIFFSQNLFFDFFNTCISISHTKNNNYELNVLDQNAQFSLSRMITMGGGVKINSINQSAAKMGAYMNASFRINTRDIIYMSYEKSFIPGFSGGLIKNNMGSIQFTKNFNFK